GNAEGRGSIPEQGSAAVEQMAWLPCCTIAPFSGDRSCSRSCRLLRALLRGMLEQSSRPLEGQRGWHQSRMETVTADRLVGSIETA
ncbi:hypothetical protein, partial [Thermogemmatispora sp.]|uniref:hypothetical protein n=1 Tax=Thermogemmatispora sp. TaxID=1968838 RepID=UPI00257AF44B